MQKKTAVFTAIVLTVLISGCASVEKENPLTVLPEGISAQPALQPQYAMLPPSEGSLWTEASDPLFEDTKARNPGDTLVVDIVENSSSRMDVNTETSRESNMNIGVPNFFGEMRKYEALANPVRKGMLADKLVGTTYTNEFEGEASSDRMGQVTASISARITEVLPNGNLSLYGRRAMKVNNEVQYIVVSGVVRPQDISSDNRVQSTYLADSSIEYFGRGALADKQKPGWGTRLFDNFWPF
ncbi:MAG: flagellar basal body L-ring protein FlgH [Thermodesulfobacteriota bacterium]|nr:flagellar basal body L-ring protein FlgH [Thermodesulfobacteriota bacterium]